MSKDKIVAKKLELKELLLPQDVNPKDKKRVEKFFKQEINFAKTLQKSSSSPSKALIAYRTHKELI